MPREMRRAEIVQALRFQGVLVEWNVPPKCTSDVDDHGGDFVAIKIYLKDKPVAGLLILRIPPCGTPYELHLDHNVFVRPLTPITVNGVLLGGYDRAVIVGGDRIAVALVKGSDDKYEVIVTAASTKIVK